MIPCSLANLVLQNPRKRTLHNASCWIDRKLYERGALSPLLFLALSLSHTVRLANERKKLEIDRAEKGDGWKNINWEKNWRHCIPEKQNNRAKYTTVIIHKMLESRKMWALLVIKAMNASPVEFTEEFESFEEPTSLASQMLTTLFQVRL